MTSKLIAAVVLLALLGCGQDTPEGRLEAAGDTLEAAEDTLADIEQRIEQHERSLADLRKKRRNLRERLFTLEERVAARATDVAVFRAVQSALLEDEALSQNAISVDADGGIVVLYGLVSSEQEEMLAIRLANTVPGVEAVRSRMEIDAGTPAAN